MTATAPFPTTATSPVVRGSQVWSAKLAAACELRTKNMKATTTTTTPGKPNTTPCKPNIGATTPPAPESSKARLRGTRPARKPLLSATDAVPSMVLLPARIAQEDVSSNPLKVLATVTKMLGEAEKSKADVEKSKGDLEKRLASSERLLLEANGTIEYISKDNRNLQDTLTESRKISQEREKQLAAKTRESVKWASKAETLAQEKQSLIGSLATEKSFCATYQKDAARFTAILGQISATMGAIDWDTLPSAVGNLKEMLVESERECCELAKSYGAMEKRRDDLQGQLTSLQDAISEALGANPEHNLIDRAEDLWREVEALRKNNNMLAQKLVEREGALAKTIEMGNIAALRNREELLAAEAALCLSVAGGAAPPATLPLWARTLFAVTLLAIVAAVAHRMGFVSGYEVAR